MNSFGLETRHALIEPTRSAGTYMYDLTDEGIFLRTALALAVMVSRTRLLVVLAAIPLVVSSVLSFTSNLERADEELGQLWKHVAAFDSSVQAFDGSLGHNAVCVPMFDFTCELLLTLFYQPARSCSKQDFKEFAQTLVQNPHFKATTLLEST